jgi:hypothetical protein
MFSLHSTSSAPTNLLTVAYNYLGTAIRMAYSIGINGSPSHRITEVIDSQSALRTWWTLYSLESDICLEYGKPLCIRETDAKAPYPEHTTVRTYCSLAYVITDLVVGCRLRHEQV